MGLVEDTYTDLRPHLVNYLRKRRPQDPEDLADAVLARCWEEEQRGRTINQSYVFEVAHNLLVDQERKDERWARRWRELSPAERGVAWQETGSLELLELLTQCEREVALLWAAGYRYREIAALLGLKEHSVRKRFYRLHQRMRRDES